MKSKFEYKWVIVGICTLMVFSVLGFCSSSASMYIAPITESLGISRSSYSFTTSVRYIATAAANAFFGVMIYRFGAKKLITAGFVSLVTSEIIYSFAENVIVFCIGSVFLGIGLSFTTTTMVGSVIDRWCPQNKGKIMGFVLAANGVGAALSRTILTPIINSGDPYGYRNAYRLVAGILVGVALVMLMFFKNEPRDYQSELGKTEQGKAGIQAEASIFTKPYFYISLVCIFLTGLVLQSTSGIADPHFRDSNVELVTITLMMSVHSIVLSVSKFTNGFIYDKFGIRVASVICYVSAVISIISLMMVGNGAVGTLFGWMYSIISSVALPLETVMLPIFARELFGKSTFNKALGIFASVNTAGYAVGGPIANFVFDTTGSYSAWLLIASVIILIVGISMNFVITAARRDHSRQEVAAEVST